MYRKYVRKWQLLKRNRIICPEIAVNSQFLPGKIDIFSEICDKKSEFSIKLPKKPRNFSQICPEKSIFFKIA